MSKEELSVIIGGLLLGYKIVNSLMSQKESDPQKADQFTAEPNTVNDNKQQSQNQTTSDESENQEEFIQKNWFRILDVSESASFTEISLQYKRKIREYHPDKVASLGKEIRDLAEFKSKEINAAFEYAKSKKGS